MKEFLVYNVLRLLLLLSSAVVVIGVWSLVADEVPVLWALVVAVLVSGVLSWFLLARQREAVALQIQERASRASAANEARRAEVRRAETGKADEDQAGPGVA